MYGWEMIQRDGIKEYRDLLLKVRIFQIEDENDVYEGYFDDKLKFYVERKKS